MFATVRRYEGIDVSQKDELTKKVGESLAPRLSKLPGFKDYFLIDTGNGVISWIGLFDPSTERVTSRLVSHPSGCATRSSEKISPQCTEDYGRRGHRSQDRRSRSGVSPGSTQRKVHHLAGLPML